jgi:predicted kinase
MRDDTPTVYLLAGPSGPGKSAYIRALEERGVDRLRADTELSEETAAALVEHLESGHDVLVEYDTADQPERDRVQRLADSARARSVAVNFTIDHDQLAARHS